jgi:hypothetical protein
MLQTISVVSLIVGGVLVFGRAHCEEPPGEGSTVLTAAPDRRAGLPDVRHRSLKPERLPDAGLIRFPAHSDLSVRFRASPVSAPEPTLDIVMKQFASLRSAANAGDAVAAYTAYRMVRECRALQNFASLKARSASGQDSGTQTAFYVEFTSFCADLADEDKAKALGWLRTAAAGSGDPKIMIEFANLNGPNAESQAVLEKAWAHGSLRALFELSNLHAVQAGADATRSLAYEWLYVKLNEAAFSLQETPSEFLHAIQKGLARKLDASGAQRRDAAIAQALEILVANHNCCQVP